MKTINITLSIIVFLIIALSIWFWGKIKTLKEQITTTKSNSTNTSNSKDFERRLKKVEDCFEE